jgi:hypothetical protein
LSGTGVLECSVSAVVKHERPVRIRAEAAAAVGGKAALLPSDAE